MCVCVYVCTKAPTASGRAALARWRKGEHPAGRWADGQLTLAVWLQIALSVSLMWSKASSLQFSGLGQAGTYRHVRHLRKCICMYICMYVCVYIYIYIYKCVCISLSLYIYIYI